MSDTDDATGHTGKADSRRTWIPVFLFAAALVAIVWGYTRQEPVPAARPPTLSPPQVGAASNTAASAPSAATQTTAASQPKAGAPQQEQASTETAGAASPQPTPPATPAAPADGRAAQVRGVIKAKEEVLFVAKIAARIAQMPYKEGERFRKGSVLVAFDCSRIRAEANAAWAANRASQQVLKQSRELDRYNAIGKSEVQIAQAKSDQTGAEATALEAQLRDCTIVAPFSGIVVETMAHQHENAPAGKDLTKVLNDDELEVHLIAPSSWLAWLRPGREFKFRIDETGRTHAAKVTRLGAAVDPVSQTVRVVGVFTGPRELVLPGMSGAAEFERPEQVGLVRP